MSSPSEKSKACPRKDSGKDKTLIKFAISDGENSVQCVAHNCNEKYGLGSGLKGDVLTAFDTIVRKSLAVGKPVKVKGCYANFKSERAFIIDTIEWAEDVQKSQLNDKVIEAFVKECAKHKIDDVTDEGNPLQTPIYST